MFNSIFWVPILSHPKAVTDVKNSLYYGRVKDMELSPSPPNYLKDSWKLLLLLISINWPSLVTWWVVNQKIYSKMQPISITNTHDITYLLNHGIAKNTKPWMSWEQNFYKEKKILDLCLRWHFSRSYCFVVEVTFKEF